MLFLSLRKITFLFIYKIIITQSDPIGRLVKHNFGLLHKYLLDFFCFFRLNYYYNALISTQYLFTRNLKSHLFWTIRTMHKEKLVTRRPFTPVIHIFKTPRTSVLHFYRS